MKQTVYLIGVGMGTPASLTVEAARAIAVCETLIGAPRLLEPYGGKTCIPLIAAADIAGRIPACRGPVGVLLSGDTGFFSGAKNLWPLLKDCEVETVAGISSLSYFAAKIGESWQDAFVVSAHGRSHNAVGEIQSHHKTFLLTGGATKAQDICKQLRDRGLEQVTITVGERLSYPEERIVTGTPSALAGECFDDLSVMLCLNPRPVSRELTSPGIPDDQFLRGKAPMTKEEIRTISVSKLRLRPGDTLWDVGAGTGSVSVEGALALPAGQVFGVEKSPEALSLLEQNKARFGVTNLHGVAGTAPEALMDLPAPDRVFVGGSSGNMEAILGVALEKNPAARFVVTAITLETLTETLRCFQLLGLSDVEIIQVAVTRTREVGPYHMMDAQNPVWVMSAEGKPHE